MGFAKKKEDIEKIMEDVERTHEHEEGHHHHHVEEAVVALQTLVEALNARTLGIEERLVSQGREIAKIYKILSLIVEAMATKEGEAERKAILEALKELEEEK